MEKKFKHKTTGEIGYYKEGIFKSGRCCVEIGVPPSSEYWEEIVEKAYEILTVTPSDLHTYYGGKDAIIPYTVCNKDLKYWDIYSVKRLSDNEVFSVGDRTNLGTIVQIQLEENGIKLWLDFQSKSVQHGGYDDTNNYQTLQKIKQDEPKYSLKDIEDALSGELFNSLRGVVIKDTILTILAASKK